MTTCAALRRPIHGHADQVTDRVGTQQKVSLTLAGTGTGRLRAGQMIAAPGTLTVHDRFRGWVHVEDGDGPGTRLRPGDRIGVHLYYAEAAGKVTGVFDHPPFDSAAPGSPGNIVLVTITLAQPVAMAVGTRFSIWVGGHHVAYGSISSAG